MKLKGLILILAAGPIIGLVLTQVLWRVYDAAMLISYVSVADFDFLMLGVFFSCWLGIAYAGTRNRGKPKRIKRAKPNITLDKDIKIGDVTEPFRPSFKNAVLEFLIIGNGKNLHKIMPYAKDATYKVGDRTYKVENNSLTIWKPMFGKIKLTAIFKSDGSPVKPKGSDGTVTAEILSLAQRSGALGRTIKEMFSTHLDLKKILFFVAIGAVVIVVFFIMSGGIF